MALPKLQRVSNSIKKKKILLLSDDLRMHSGIGTMSREFVKGTIHKYDWVQIGGAIKHPDKGKAFDLSQDLTNETGVSDAYLKIYPIDGYGNPAILKEIMRIEKPDAIMHFTDPRFWRWLYNIEHEIRQEVPIMYYTIWDDLPNPVWNHTFYESCDWLGCISKQTYGIVNHVRNHKMPPEEGGTKDWQIDYVPHGIDSNMFKPMDISSKFWSHYNSFKVSMLDNKDYDFILYYNNRNIRRKQTSDIVLAWNEFCNKLTPEQANKCLLLMHTPAVDPNGTDLNAVKEALCPNYNIKFSQNHITPLEMTFMYNIADVTINIASNEGFGLSGAESIMSGTPIINNITGGLQDHCGFALDGVFLTADDYIDIGSLHDDRKWKDNPKLTWGEWVTPIWPSNRSIQGSPETPFIFDDRARYDDVAEAIKQWYDTPKAERAEKGLLGREYAINDGGLSSKNMADCFIKGIDNTLNNWTKRRKFTLYKA